MKKYIIKKTSYNGFISILTLIMIFSCQSDPQFTHKPISDFSNRKDSISYSIGADIGDNLIGQGMEIDYNAFITGLKNGYEKKDHLLTTQDRKGLFKVIQNQMRDRQRAIASEGLAAAESYLKKNKAENPGVIETRSGLQYKIIKKGTGKSPSSSMDQVRVHRITPSNLRDRHALNTRLCANLELLGIRPEPLLSNTHRVPLSVHYQWWTLSKT